MSWKTLIHTEAFYDEDSPHLLLTAIEENSYDRERGYGDVVGIFIVGADLNDFVKLSLNYYVEQLEKNIILIIETPEEENQLEAWAFDKETLKPTKMKVCTTNDVNYDIWLEEESFWDPSDFIFADEAARNTKSIESRLDGIEEKVGEILKQIAVV